MIEITAFLSFNIAVILLICGKILTMRYAVLQKYSIPEPVTGGLLCASVVGLIYLLFDSKVQFDLKMRDFLLLVFFAGIGLKSDVRTLLKGGRPLLVLVTLATLFILMQNLTGMGIASAFGHDPKAGLIVGSISLTGGVGTTLAWAPIFSEQHGIGNAMELGVAANTVGLIAACLIGGPIAAFLIRRRAVVPGGSTKLDIGRSFDAPQTRMDYFSLLWAILITNFTIMIGLGLHGLIETTGVTLPAFVSCLLAGIAVRYAMSRVGGRTLHKTWPGIGNGLALLSDLSLGLFLIMALMSLHLWELQGTLLFITTVLLVQILLTVCYAVFIVFPAMGRDYEATVISSGFGGITLGSTATAIANMTAVTQQHGAAHRAFVIVPLVCGFFIDIINA